MRVLDEHTIGFADFSGNRQYISTANVQHNDRGALIFMDYPKQARLKIIGHVEVIEQSRREQLATLDMDNYRARVERAFLIHIKAFD